MGKRGWKMVYAVLKDLILYQYKDEHHEHKGQFVQVPASKQLCPAHCECYFWVKILIKCHIHRGQTKQIFKNMSTHFCFGK